MCFFSAGAAVGETHIALAALCSCDSYVPFEILSLVRCWNEIHRAETGDDLNFSVGLISWKHRSTLGTRKYC